jgi:hypothetical protein
LLRLVELRIECGWNRLEHSVPGGCAFQFSSPGSGSGGFPGRCREREARIAWPGCIKGASRTFECLQEPIPKYSEMATSTLPCATLSAPHHCINVLHPQQQHHTSINSILERPIPNSYWATPLLLACEYPWCPGLAKQKIESLLAAGVRTFIDLTEVNELRHYGSYLSGRAEAMGLADIEYHRFPIVDRSLPESVEYMRSILRVLRDNGQRGRITAVHCRGGIGRTGKPALPSHAEDQFLIIQLLLKVWSLAVGLSNQG